MFKTALVLAALLVIAGTAHADLGRTTMVAIDMQSRVSLVDRTWPNIMPADAGAPPAMAVKAIELGNAALRRHVPVLTHDFLSLELDAKNQRARVRLGKQLLNLSSDVEFLDGSAKLSPRLALGTSSHSLTVRLPDVELSAAEYRNERGIEVRLPLVHRAF